MRVNYPKISVITPSYNQGKYLDHTILSVLNQNYPNLEYIIIDGGSTDDSVEIIKKYQNRLSYWVSEPDDGMYYALQKGFARTTGEIMGWINSDDMLHSKSLFSIAEILTIEGVNWIQGMPTLYDESGRTVRANSEDRWSRLRFFMNDHAYIQQESTFWRRDLWEKSGGYMSTQYKLAGDFDLWNRFFNYDQLFTPQCLIGGYRLRTGGQLTNDYSKYTREADDILKESLAGSSLKSKIERVKKLERIKKLLRQTRILNIFFITNRIDKIIASLYNYPAEIYFDRDTQKFQLDKKQ